MDLTTDTLTADTWHAPLSNPLLIGIAKFLCPIGIVAGLLSLLYLIQPYQDFLFLGGLTIAYFVPPAGKESIIPIAILTGHPWWLVTMVFFLLDVAVSLFVVWNFDLALKIPLVGRILESGMAAAQNYTENQPWIRRLSTFGLILFVFFPFQGTGAMNGSIVGRLLGMDPARVFGSVAAGSFASCLVISLGADVLLDVYQEDPTLGIALFGTVLAAIVLAVVGWQVYRRRLRERER
jgi:uncharacterized membrane protein